MEGGAPIPHDASVPSQRSVKRLSRKAEMRFFQWVCFCGPPQLLHGEPVPGRGEARGDRQRLQLRHPETRYRRRPAHASPPSQLMLPLSAS